VALQVLIVLFAVFEFGRMALVSTTVANAARTAVRYAIVHGSTRTGTGVDGPSGPGSTTEISANVTKYASAGVLDTSRLNISVTYPDATTNNPGSRVVVTVVYPYDPFTVLPLHVNLGATAEGIIAF
jgi:Flp pilus assembly protein TadG